MAFKPKYETGHNTTICKLYSSSWLFCNIKIDLFFSAVHTLPLDMPRKLREELGLLTNTP